MDSAIDDRFGDLNRTAGKARNESVLLNIARASERIPLTFVAFQKVSGGLSANVSAAMPAFSLGPHGPTAAVQRDVSIGSSTLGSASSASNSMDLTVIETQDFYHALLDPGDLVTFYHFLEGYPRELLFWIFVDSVRISIIDRTKPGKVFMPREPGLKLQEVVELQNRPSELQSCRKTVIGRLCFSDMIELAMLAGVTIQTQDKPKSTSATNKTNQAKSNTITEGLEGRLCLDSFLQKQTEIFIRQSRPDYRKSDALQKLMLAVQVTPQNSSVPTCYVSGRFRLDPIYPDRLMLRSVTPTREYQYEIRPRSTFAIYQYLGSILAEDKTDTIVVTGLEPETLKSRQILAVSKDRTTNCVVRTTLRDKSYCVPNENSELTKLIFNLLSQLIALKTQAKDLGLTPTFRVQ